MTFGATNVIGSGNLLAAKAVPNDDEGVTIHDLIREPANTETMDLGVKALGKLPLKRVKQKQGNS